MQGLCVSRIDLSEQVVFSEIFEPIMSFVKDLYWICYGYQSSPFIDLIYEEGGGDILEQLICLKEKEGYSVEILKPEAVTQYGKYLLSDWITMVGVSNVDNVVLEFCDFIRHNAQKKREEYSYIDNISQMCFFNVDGHSWEFYSHDEHYLKLIKDYHINDPSIELRESPLSEREQILWNNWGLEGSEEKDLEN